MRLFSLLVLLFFFNITQAQDNLFKHFSSLLSLTLDENFQDNRNDWKESRTPGKYLVIGKGQYNLIGSANSKLVTTKKFEIDLKNDFMINLLFEIKAQSDYNKFAFIFGENNRYNFTFDKHNGAKMLIYVDNKVFDKEKLNSSYDKKIKLDLIKSGSKLNIFLNNEFIKSISILKQLNPTFGFLLEDAGAVQIHHLKIYSDSNLYMHKDNFINKSTDNFKSLLVDGFDSNKTSWPLSQLPHYRNEINKGRYILISSMGMEKSTLKDVDINKNDDYIIETSITKKGAAPHSKFGVNWNVFNNEVYQGIQVINGNKVYYIDQTINSEIKELLTTVNLESTIKIKAIKIADSLYIFINNKYTKAFKTPNFIANQLGFYTKLTGALAIDYIKVYSGNFSKLSSEELNKEEVMPVVKPEPIILPKEKIVKKIDVSNQLIFESTSTPFNYSNNKLITQSHEVNKGGFSSALPPILKIEHISFSKNILAAGEKAILKLGIKNIGPGNANDIYLDIRSNIAELNFLNQTNFPEIKANGGVEELSVEIEAGMNLSNKEAVLKINIIEPHFKLKIQGKQILFKTKEFQKPKLIIAKFATTENQAVDPNNEVNINEIIDVKLAIQNIGLGSAQDVKVKVENSQKGVMLLGVINKNELKRVNPVIDKINSGDYDTITYRFFINSEFVSKQLKFSITSSEKYGRYGFFEEKTVSLNTQLAEEGYIRTINKASADTANNSVIIKDLLEFTTDQTVDVDRDIPNISESFDNRYAVIIGNEDYKSKQTDLTYEQNVEFAVNDAKIFTIYCEKVLGIPQRQIKLLINATSAEMKQATAWLTNLMSIESGNAEIFYYYSGHGLPHQQTKESYLIPVDVSGNNLEFAINLQDLYKQLSKTPSKNITLFLDACFSGGGRNQGLLAMKGVKIKPKANFLLNKMVVFTSSTGEESSSVYREKKHGYFTYFLLKKLKESKGNISYSELGNYINSQVRKETGINGLIQTPQINVSSQLEPSWMDLKINPNL